jgi:hypothetical protein
MLDESSIQEKAIEVFQYHAQIAESQGLGDALPPAYEINGVYIWIDIENGMVSIENPYLFSVRNSKHIEAIEIAQAIYSELACLNGILYFCEDGEINEEAFYRNGVFSEDAMNESWDWVQTMFSNPYYHAIPTRYRAKIDAVISKYAMYIIFYPEHKKARELEAMRASTRHGYIYLLQSTVGYWKIGRSGVPVQRISKLGVVLPFEIDVEALVETGDMYALESDLHRKYKTKRINGEWFALEPDDIAYIKSLAVQA